MREALTVHDGSYLILREEFVMHALFGSECFLDILRIILLDDVVFSRISIPEDKTTYYVGEYIPLQIKVYYLPEVKLELEYPQVSSEKGEIIFRNYQNVNKENPRFDRPRHGMEEIDGKTNHRRGRMR